MSRAQPRRGLRLAGLPALALSVALPGSGAAQAASPDRYLNHQELTRAVQDLVGRHGNLASVSSLARTDGGRDVWLITVAGRDGRPPEERPALLVVANLEANHLVGSVTALRTVEHLLEGYGADEAVTRLLDERTVYVLPRMNPDGAELYWSLSGYEIPWKPVAGDAVGGGLSVRERGVDLNGDGLVTLMRVRDPEGGWIEDPAEPRLVRPADRTRAERGVFKVMVEGIDPVNLEAYVPMGTDGVNLNTNFQHEYRYFQPHVGPHMVSEVETRALADFLYDRTNIAAVLTFSAYDNLRSPTPTQRSVPAGVTGNPPNVPTNLLSEDRPYFEFVSERFVEMTGLRGDGAPDEAGSFPQFAYYQMGLPSFTTPVWTLAPAAAGEGGGAAREPGGRDAAPSRDARWLAWFDEVGVDGFVEWTAARHPTLGEVEVGGFRPNVRVNPPVSELPELARLHAEFAVWLGNQLPEVEVVETRVESRGENVFLVTAVLANERYFPTQTGMGGRIRYNRPITVRLAPADGLVVLSGNIQQQTPRLEGMGGRATYTWLVQARPGTRTDLHVFAERAGGQQSIPLTLR
jgi:hypothetical protein